MIFDDKFDTWFTKNFSVNSNGKIMYLITGAYLPPCKVALVYKSFLEDTNDTISSDDVLVLIDKLTSYCMPKKEVITPTDVVLDAFKKANISDDDIVSMKMKDLNFIALCYNDNLHKRIPDVKIRRAVKSIKLNMEMKNASR